MHIHAQKQGIVITLSNQKCLIFNPRISKVHTDITLVQNKLKALDGGKRRAAVKAKLPYQE